MLPVSNTSQPSCLSSACDVLKANTRIVGIVLLILGLSGIAGATVYINYGVSFLSISTLIAGTLISLTAIVLISCKSFKKEKEMSISHFDSDRASRQMEISRDYYNSSNRRSSATNRLLDHSSSSRHKKTNSSTKTREIINEKFDLYPWPLEEKPESLSDEEVRERLNKLEGHPNRIYRPVPPDNLEQARKILTCYWRFKMMNNGQ